MTGKGLNTPVLLILLNKPEATRQVFERITNGGDLLADDLLIHSPYVIRNLEADAQYFLSVLSKGNSAVLKIA